jgi:hypothetical protein
LVNIVTLIFYHVQHMLNLWHAKVILWGAADCNNGPIVTYPSKNPGKFGKTGEKFGMSAGALIRPVKEERIICRTVSQGCLYKIQFIFCSYNTFRISNHFSYKLYLHEWFTVNWCRLIRTHSQFYFRTESVEMTNRHYVSPIISYILNRKIFHYVWKTLW